MFCKYPIVAPILSNTSSPTLLIDDDDPVLYFLYVTTSRGILSQYRYLFRTLPYQPPAITYYVLLINSIPPFDNFLLLILPSFFFCAPFCDPLGFVSKIVRFAPERISEGDGIARIRLTGGDVGWQMARQTLASMCSSFLICANLRPLSL